MTSEHQLQVRPRNREVIQRTADGGDRQPDVLFIEDLVRELRTSRRTIARLRRQRVFPIPELPSLDKRPRWSRVAVEQFLAGGPRRVSRPVKSAANAR